jgi:hypothetical protein
MLPPLPDWIAAFRRMSGKSVTARTSITPQAWLAVSPSSSRPIDCRTTLRAPSHPTTYSARTVIVSPPSRRRVTMTGWSSRVSSTATSTTSIP